VERELAALTPLDYQRLLDYERYGPFGHPPKKAKRLASQMKRLGSQDEVLAKKELTTINRRHDQRMARNPWFRLYQRLGTF